MRNEGADFATISTWLLAAFITRPEALQSVTGEMVVEGTRLRLPKTYCAQVMTAAELRHLAYIMISHTAENLHHGRTIYVDLQAEPSVQRQKDKFLTMRNWVRGVLADPAGSKHHGRHRGNFPIRPEGGSSREV